MGFGEFGFRVGFFEKKCWRSFFGSRSLFLFCWWSWLWSRMSIADGVYGSVSRGDFLYVDAV